MQLIFGIGALWGNRSDVSGIGPDQFGVLQDNTIDFSFEVKELYSQQQFPIDIARGKGKITGKAKFARVFGAIYADLFFGATVVSGENNTAEYEAHTLATNTLAVTNAATFVADLGVYFTGPFGQFLTYVTGAPGAGQYGVIGTSAPGVYTFNAADIGKAIVVSYVYTDASGKTVTISNNFMGYTPTFVGTFYSQRSTQNASGQLTLRLNGCVSSHLTFPNRIDDYAIPDFDFQAFAPAGNNGSLGTISTSE